MNTEIEVTGNGVKVGSLVYYKKNYGTYVDTIPCEVTAMNKKTVTLFDGYDTYKNVRYSSIVLQGEY